MLESLAVTLVLLAFLSVLLGGEALLKRKNIRIGGLVPIDQTLYKLGKYSIFIPWTAMLLQSWGFHISHLQRPKPLIWVSLVLWILGFAFLFVGRFGLGKSFRIGIARESCGLKSDGIYKFSRNPMYLGIYATTLASSLYTLNAIVIYAAFIVALVHHKIVLAEEEHLRKTFGPDYEDYCRRVRRYL